MTAALLEAYPRRFDGADVESLIGTLTNVYGIVAQDDPDGDKYTVADYLTDDVQRYAAERAINGGALPHNGATAKALTGAIVTLEAFHTAELMPLDR